MNDIFSLSKNIVSAFFLCLILTCSIATAHAQDAPSSVHINGRQINLPRNASSWLNTFSSAPSGPILALIQFESLPDVTAKSRLADHGITLITYLSERSFLAKIERSRQSAQPMGIISIVAVDARWKIAATLASMQSGPAKAVDVIISFLPGIDAFQIKEIIASSGGMLKNTPIAAHGFYEASVPANQLLTLASNYQVIYISQAAADVPLNLESQRATKASVAHAPVSVGGWGLLGDSIIVGVGDNTSGLGHIDLRDRIINFNPAGYTNHGQHTNGTVGGAGTIDPRAEGFAPHVQLLDHIYNLVWERTGAMQQAYNMSVTNNSYANKVGSCKDAGVYDLYAQALDTIALKYSDVLHVFASGNDGGMTCSPFPTAYATVTGGYQTAKNVLVVGNITKQYIPNPGTSRGPIKDGRLKPEIASVGSGVYSTGGGGDNRYQSASGTSMACPQITGSAALLQQRYKQLHAGVYPSSALTKALLMNGALDLGTPGPDFTYGFGIADVSRSLTMIDSNRYLSGNISQGSTQTPVTINVPANTGQLKVMLYWHDAPASPLSGTQLINDLDLKVLDPSGATQLPFILNPAPASVTAPATRAADHLNNVEQVVIDQPAAGAYTVNISGYNIPFGPQQFVVVYDLMPSGITLSTPLQDDVFKSGDWLNFYWNASPSTATFTVEFSDNNGSNWIVLSNSVAATERQFLWTATGGYNSAQCRLRITRNGTGEQVTSGRFTMNVQPVLALSNVQCPGYVNLHWSPVPGATGYTMMRKIGYYLQPTATVTDTAYSAGGLRTDSSYYFAVQPLFGSNKGYRSLAISRQPNDGTCAGAFSDGDLMLEGIAAPSSGRIATGSALTANENLSILIRNLDNDLAPAYKLSYQLNGGTWMSQTVNNLAPNGTAMVTFPGLNMAAPGTYIIRAAVSNLAATDPVSSNDTMIKVVRQLQNVPVDLTAGFIDDFEALPRLTLLTDSMGFTGNEHWDYYNSHDTGRLRSFVDGDISIGGSRSITMDMSQNNSIFTPVNGGLVLSFENPAFNKLTGTFNLATAGMITDEVRFEFDYKLHGIPKYPDSNLVWIRGSDTQPWKPLYRYDTSVMPGMVIHSGTLSVNDALSAAGQSFSSSTQIAFGQRDTSVVAQNDYGNGLTLDNVKLYKVVNDAGISALLSPAESNCSLGATTPLTVTVYNGVNASLSNIYLYYQLDGGPVVRDTLEFLPGKTNVSFTFSQLLNTRALGTHTLSVWLSALNDSYAANDSIMAYAFRNEPLIASYPYLQDFESGDGYWYSSGLNSSWAFGKPAATKIHKAASGVNAWKTSLAGHYSDNELSYLYSPCFNISALSQPMLSFSLAKEIENCGGTLCDGAWVEYSIDGGATWLKLGSRGQGTNWYDTSFNVWNTDSPARWQVASIPLPASAQPMRFRFVMSSDAGAGYEGIAIDDIHVFDRAYPLYTGGAVGPIEQDVNGSGFKTFESASAVLAQLEAGAENAGKTSLKLYEHSKLFDEGSLQYYLPKNFVIQTQNALSDSVLTRLYISDADVVKLLAATGCDGCSKPEDAYELGITKYDNSNKNLENGSLADNDGGSYNFIPSGAIKWVPYDAGYYAEVKLKSFSELWFNGGGASNAFALTQSSLDFDAKKSGNSSVLVTWLSRVDTSVLTYEVQRAVNTSDFVSIDTVASVKDNSHSYTVTDLPGAVSVPALYYRLKYTLRNGKAYYSPIRQVIWSGRAAALQVYPNPTHDGKVKIDWSTLPGAVMDLSVTDVAGKAVARINVVAVAYSNTTEMNLGNVSKGIYFIHATIAGERFDTKLLVE